MAFLSGGVIASRLGRPAAVCPRLCRSPPVAMASLADPESDEPPALADLGKPAPASTGKPIRLGTGRAPNFRDAFLKAKAGIDGAVPTLCHVTISEGIDGRTVWQAAVDAVDPAIALLGRSVVKEGVSGVVEVLLVAANAEASFAVGTASGDISRPGSLEQTVASATRVALGKVGLSEFAVAVFAHTPGASETSVRQALREAFPGVVAYGGPAVGGGSGGQGWTWFTREALVQDADPNEQRVAIATIPGSIVYMISAVLKSWTQPKYVKPLEFMIPSYVGDPAVDLLTAIRYNDWDKFIQCIEVDKVPIDYQWESKQHQTPLLAACARCRLPMVRYLLERGANPLHRNDGGFTCVMYTKMLAEFDPAMVNEQLELLREYGAEVALSVEDQERFDRVQRVQKP